MRLRHITRHLLPLLLALGITACGDNSVMREPDNAAGDMVLSFTLRIEGQAGVRSRAEAVPGTDYPYEGYGPTWGEDYPSVVGNDFENRLLKEHFHVLLLDGNNAVIGKILSDDLDVLVYNHDGATIYSFLGVLDTAWTPAEFDNITDTKIMVFANGSAYSDGAALGDITFSHVGGPSATFRAIPMWGVAQADLKGIRPGVARNVGEVPMLRAMAKVVVDIDSELRETVKLTGLTVANCNTAGYQLPRAWDMIKATDKLDIYNTQRIPADPGAATGLEAAPTADSTAIEFYVPEYANSAEAEFLMAVDYTVEGEPASKPGLISLRKYVDGKPAADSGLWPVVRNHIYHYTVTGIASDGLRFKAEIIDMEEGGDYYYEY